jgi:hypothetical protein
VLDKLGLDPVPHGLHVERLRNARPSIRSAKVTAGDRLIFEIAAPDKLLVLAVGTHQEIDRLIDRTSVLRAISEPGDEIRPDDFGEFTVFHRQGVNMAALLNEVGGLLKEVDAHECLDAVQSVIARVTAGDTTGKAATPRISTGGGAPINVIPSDRGASAVACTPILLAFCFDGDSFDTRLHEIERHVTLDCRDTRLVILVTTQWQPKVWKKKYEDAFSRIDPLVAVFFSGFGILTRLV